MEVIGGKALRVRVRNPHRFTAVIPKCHYEGEVTPGIHEILVNWGYDESLVLKNMGVKCVPSPINRTYDWPGMYKPMAHQKETAEFLTMHRRAFCFDEMGLGKRLALGTPVLTPSGWTPIEALCIGDSVFGQDGLPHSVTATYRHEDRPLFRITFNDGTWIDADDEHLWAVQHVRNDTAQRYPETADGRWRVMTTAQILEAGLKDSAGNLNWRIPLVKPVQMCADTYAYPDGYLVGAALGDGSWKSGSQWELCTDREILKSVGCSRIRAHATCDRVGYGSVDLQLPKMRAHEKALPYALITAPEYYRRDVLAGLMDTDGWVNPSGTVQFSSASRDLSLGLGQLVQSLGGTFTMRIKHSPQYTYKGETRTGLPAYVVTIRMNENPFRLTRKAAQWKPLSKYKPTRIIKSVERIANGPGVCISVDSPDNLYITKQYIVTHNTAASAWAADYLMNIGQVRRVLIICPVSIMQAAWQQDLFKVLMHRTVGIAHGAREKRVSVIDSGCEFCIINYDGVQIVEEEIKAGGFDLIILDEATYCFVAGNLVATPYGAVPIEQLRNGDEVLTSDGITTIRQTTRQLADNIVTMRLSNGQEIQCTAEHPFFTDRGWLTAEATQGRRLIHSADLSDMRQTVPTTRVPVSVVPTEADCLGASLLRILREEAVPYAEPREYLMGQSEPRAQERLGGVDTGEEADRGAAGGDISPIESLWAQTTGSTRQWVGHDSERSNDSPFNPTRIHMELDGTVGAEARRLSYELQSRLWKSDAQDSARSGWAFASGVGAASTGSEERDPLSGTWVESVTYKKRGCKELVYNLDLEGTPHYYVGGCLVHNCKNSQAKRSKSIGRLLGVDTRVWLMTGTPAAQSPEDAYGLAKLVSPDRIPKFFGAWRDMVMQKLSMYKWVPRARAKDLVHTVLQPAIRHTKEECLDLPDMVFVDRMVPLTKQQEKYYKTLKEKMIAVAAGEEITAVNAAAALNKLLQLSCITYDTMTLTDSGWKQLGTITLGDRLWDGVEWVQHDGVVLNGERDTVWLDGVRMTPDHRVLTVSGWVTAEGAIDDKSSKKFARAAVRLPNGYSPGGDYCGDGDAVRSMAVPLRVRGGGDTPESVSKIQTQDQTPQLRMPSWKRNTSYDFHSTLQDLVRYAAEVFRYTRQGLQELRSAWHHRVSCLGEFLREFLGRYAARLCGAVNFGSDGQQWWIQQRKLPVGNYATTSQQYSKECFHNHPQGSYDCCTSSAGVWAENGNLTRSHISVPLGGRSSVNGAPGGTQKVYDIVNAGPRARFTVKGEGNQPIIVHNCGCVYADSESSGKKTAVEFDIKPRLDALADVIEESTNKVIVFAPFRHTISMLERDLAARGYTTATISGDVPSNKRGPIFAAFQYQPEPRIIIIQPQAAAHGVTLTEASTVVWFGPTTSLDTYLQANARAHRKGQKNKVTVVHMQGSAVEAKLYRALSVRGAAHVELLDLYREVLSG